MKNRTTTLIMLITVMVTVAMSQYTYNYLQIQHPQQTWRYGQGTIEQALVSVRPKGNYVQHDVYLSISAKNLGFSATDSVEVQMEFSLPKEAIVNDLWLWMDENTIMKGLILDRWTASSIYEDIVKRRRDPALLMKNSDLQYSLKIYPMAGLSYRKIKITYLLPVTVSGASVASALPMNMFRISKVPLNKVTVFFWPDHGYTTPTLSEVPSAFESSPRLDQQSNKQYYYGEIPASSISSTVTLRSTVPAAGVFVGKYENILTPGEGFFQVSFNPSAVFNVNTAQKIAFLFEFDESRSSYSTLSFMNTLRMFMLANLSSKDSFNLIFSGSQIKRVKLSGWLGADSATVNATFDQISQSMLQNASNMQALLTDGIDFIRSSGNSGVIWLFAGSDKFNTYSSVNPAIQSIAELLKPTIPIHITDLSNWNVNFSYFNNKYYYGNDYFYENLSRLTGSLFTSYRQNSSLQTNLSGVLEQVRGTLKSFDMITRIENGFCSNRYITGNPVTSDIAMDRTITQIGRFKGQFPFVLEIAGIYRGQILTAKISVPENNAVNLDASLETIWAGNYLASLEALPQTNSNTKSILDISLSYRVLSRYSAFLALEPNDTLKACLTCRDESKLVPVVANGGPLVPNDDSLLTAFPNPFNPSTSIRVKMPLGATGKESSLRIFNTMGQQVAVLDISRLSSGAVADITWNGRNDDGSPASSGVYVAVLTTPVKRASVKLVLMK